MGQWISDTEDARSVAGSIAIGEKSTITKLVGENLQRVSKDVAHNFEGYNESNHATYTTK